MISYVPSVASCVLLQPRSLVRCRDTRRHNVSTPSPSEKPGQYYLGKEASTGQNEAAAGPKGAKSRFERKPAAPTSDLAHG
jgi:hypothetical protein